MKSLEEVIKQKCKFIGNSKKKPTNYTILNLILILQQIFYYL